MSERLSERLSNTISEQTSVRQIASHEISFLQESFFLPWRRRVSWKWTGSASVRICVPCSIFILTGRSSNSPLLLDVRKVRSVDGKNVLLKLILVVPPSYFPILVLLIII